MTPLPVTSLAASLLGIIYMVLAVRVSMQRRAARLSIGDGAAVGPGQEPVAPKLFLASRCHMNFVEYVPLTLILLALCELQGAARPIIMVMAAALVVGRVMHPFGMGRPVPNIWRGGGIMLNMLVLAAAIVLLLLRTLA